MNRLTTDLTVTIGGYEKTFPKLVVEYTHHRAYSGFVRGEPINPPEPEPDPFGMGVKPSDCFVIPLCSAAHREQHNVGEAEFQRIYGINMRRIADSLWLKSPHGRRYRAEHQ